MTLNDFESKPILKVSFERLQNQKLELTKMLSQCPTNLKSKQTYEE